MKTKANAVVVFDLDDTLFKEIDYQKSGFDAVLASLVEVYGDEFVSRLEFIPNLKSDWLSQLCNIFNLPLTVKESLLWIYRLHTPAIKISRTVFDVLQVIDEKNQIVILTDGRSITQRKKLKSLGLDHFPVYISEEYGDVKTSYLRFNCVENDFPAKRYFYVGDNPKKDFEAPNYLGWTTVGIRDDGRNIHSQNEGIQINTQLPQIWLNSFEELLEVIC